MNDADYVAQLFTLFCVASSFIVLMSQEKIAFPFYGVFSVLLIPSSFIWLFSLWTLWTWFFPVLMVSLAAATVEAAWKMTDKLHPKEQQNAFAFSVLVGSCLAALAWAARPLYPRFPSLSMLAGMAGAAFSVGCAVSAGAYWWANRSAGVRPVVKHGGMLAAYGLIVIAAAVVSGLDPDGPGWHWTVQTSCYLRGIVQGVATMTLVRSQRFFSAHA